MNIIIYRTQLFFFFHSRIFVFVENFLLHFKGSDMQYDCFTCFACWCISMLKKYIFHFERKTTSWWRVTGGQWPLARRGDSGA